MKLKALTLLNLLALTLLPIALAEYHLDIDVPMSLKDVVTVTGKKTADGEVKEMSFGTDSPLNANGCYPGDGDRHSDCEGQTEYTSMTRISFDQVTDKPRNLVISMPGYNLSCGVSIFEVDTNLDTFWAADLGLYPQKGWEDAIDIRCLNQTT